MKKLIISTLLSGVAFLSFAQVQFDYQTKADNNQISQASFSPDGELYYSSSQDMIKVFDTSNPYEWEVVNEYC